MSTEAAYGLLWTGDGRQGGRVCFNSCAEQSHKATGEEQLKQRVVQLSESPAPPPCCWSLPGSLEGPAPPPSSWSRLDPQMIVQLSMGVQ